MTEFTRLQELAYEVKIEEVMTRDPITVSPEATMSELREILREHRISGAPVVESGQMVGIISLEDLIKALANGAMDLRVGEKMTRNPITVHADETVVMAVNTFARYRFGRFPVIDRNGQLVGILTRGDIMRGLLKQLDFEYHREETLRHRVSHVFEELISDLTSLTLHYNIVARDFERAGQASSNVKRALNRLGFPPQIVRRAAIAAYELEINIVIHTDQGGEIMAEIQPDRIIIRAVDTGPGIADIDRALQPGFSTAPEWIREMGFGAGMGLINVQKCADEMLLESPNHMWTSAKIVIHLAKQHTEEEGDSRDTARRAGPEEV